MERGMYRNTSKKSHGDPERKFSSDDASKLSKEAENNNSTVIGRFGFYDLFILCLQALPA
jgi:hypothetical protein